jgi:hypothetical protein
MIVNFRTHEISQVNPDTYANKKNYNIDAGMANKIFFNQTNNSIPLYKLCYKLCYFSK